MTPDQFDRLERLFKAQFNLIDEYAIENQSLRKELMFWKYLCLLYSVFMSLYVIVDLTT